MLTLNCTSQRRKALGGILICVKIILKSEAETRNWGEQLGRVLSSGVVIELVGDVGAGKTTLTKGIAAGLDVDEDVQSPSFTISRVYDARDGLQLAHYDFYRLHDAGIMADELRDVVRDPTVVTVIEWADIVDGVLPLERIQIRAMATSETERELEITGPADILEKL